jgi:hypothetical protein
MREKEVTVSCSYPLVVDKYEQLKPFVSVTAQLEDGDDLDACIKELHLKVAIQWQQIALRDLALYSAVRGSKSAASRSLKENLELDFDKALSKL